MLFGNKGMLSGNKGMLSGNNGMLSYLDDEPLMQRTVEAFFRDILDLM